jgi:hypothetical protein
MAVTVFGVVAVTFMMIMYALESRHRGLVLAFALGCAMSSSYGFIAGVWPFGVVEAIWTVVAIRRYVTRATGAARQDVPHRGAANRSARA